MYSSVLRVAVRSFAEVAAKPAAQGATKAASGSEDPIKKIFLNKLSDYASKKPKDYDAKQLAEAMKNKK